MSQYIPISLRVKLWDHYYTLEKGKAKCPFNCGHDILQMDFKIAHIVSEANGGSDIFENLMPICEQCLNKLQAHKNFNVADYVVVNNIKLLIGVNLPNIAYLASTLTFGGEMGHTTRTYIEQYMPLKGLEDELKSYAGDLRKYYYRDLKKYYFEGGDFTCDRKYLYDMLDNFMDLRNAPHVPVLSINDLEKANAGAELIEKIITTMLDNNRKVLHIKVHYLDETLTYYVQHLHNKLLKMAKREGKIIDI